MSRRRLLVLVDQDGVLADFERAFRDALVARGVAPVARRTTYLLQREYGEALTNEIMGTRDFFRRLPLIEGAVEGMRRLAAAHDVYICTAPIDSPHVVPEKFAWIGEHLGPEWVARTIVTRDKTVVRGDVLIDDRPDIVGVYRNPEWAHVLYDAEYNRDALARLRMRGWRDWAWLNRV